MTEGSGDSISIEIPKLKSNFQRRPNCKVCKKQPVTKKEEASKIKRSKEGEREQLDLKSVKASSIYDSEWGIHVS